MLFQLSLNSNPGLSIALITYYHYFEILYFENFQQVSLESWCQLSETDIMREYRMSMLTNILTGTQKNRILAMFIKM